MTKETPQRGKLRKLRVPEECAHPRHVPHMRALEVCRRTEDETKVHAVCRCPAEIQDLVLRCVTPDVAARPTMKEVIDTLRSLRGLAEESPSAPASLGMPAGEVSADGSMEDATSMLMGKVGSSTLWTPADATLGARQGLPVYTTAAEAEAELSKMAELAQHRDRTA